MSRHRMIISIFAVSAALALAGCGSDGGAYGGSNTSKSTTTAAADAAAAPVDLSGKVNDKGSKDISGDGATAKVDIEVDDNYFKPTFVKAAPGATVEVHLANEGGTTHTFTLDDASVDQTLEPGDDATVTVTVPESGSLRFSCNFHGSMGMQGAFYTA